MSGDARAGAHLVDREHELRRVRAVIGPSADREGPSIAVVAGSAGVGKTSLLDAAVAAHPDVRVRRARGHRAETASAFGVAEQLVGPLWDELGDLVAERFERLAGLAGGALGRGPTAAEPDQEVDAVAGLWHVVETAAAREPLLLVVDDLHWADGPSVRFLLHVARRVQQCDLRLVVSARATDADERRLQSLGGLPGAIRVDLGPLSHAAITSLLVDRVGDDGHVLASAVGERTGGNPSLVVRVISTLAEGDADLAEGPADLDRISAEVAGSVLGPRIRNLSDDARALIGPVAAVAPRGAPQLLAELSGLPDSRVEPALVELVQADLIDTSAGVDFAHELLRDATLEWLGPTVLGHHERAIDVLTERGAPDELIADHAVELPGRGDQERVSVLESAAISTMARGETDRAIHLLHRALDEPPARDRRAGLLRMLAEAEGLADHGRATDHLREAVQLLDAGGPERGELRALLAGLLLSISPVEAVAEGLGAAEDLGGFDGPERATAATSVARVALARMLTEPRLALDEPSEALIGSVAATGGAAAAMLACVQSFEAVMANDPQSAVTRPLDAMLGAGGIVQHELLTEPALTFGLMALAAYDHPGLRRYLEVLEAASERTGSLATVITTSIVKAEVAWADGDLTEAEEHASRGLEAADDYGIRGTGVGYLSAVLSHAHRERGDFDAAARVLRDAVDADAGSTGGIVRIAGIDGAAAALAEIGPPAPALDGWLELGRRAESTGAVSPALVPWRSRAAGLLAKIGRHADGLATARAEVDLGRECGAPRAVGRALRSAAALSRDSDCVPLLEEAYDRLRPTTYRLDRARSALSLGRALHRQGHTGRAGGLLREALADAQRSRAAILVHEAMAVMGELGIAPGRPALTPRQRDVVGLAVRGLSNADIADALTLSVRTIETHLANVYAKLGIHSRAELAGAIGTNAP